MKLIKVYQVEVGVLLNKDNPEYEAYSNVWDHNNAYYDEDFAFYKKYSDAKEFIDYYIKNGVTNTYGILSEVYISEDYFKELNNESKDNYYDLDYNAENVIYSAYKNKNKETIENFVDYKFIRKGKDEFENEEVQ